MSTEFDTFVQALNEGFWCIDRKDDVLSICVATVDRREHIAKYLPKEFVPWTSRSYDDLALDISAGWGDLFQCLLRAKGVPPIIASAEMLMFKTMAGYDKSHDYEHVLRVVRHSLLLARMEGIEDPITLETIHLAALLHDVGDAKYCKDEYPYKPVMELFCRYSYDGTRVLHVLKNIGYKQEMKHLKEGVKCYDVTNAQRPKFVRRDPNLHTDELCIVQDADRLDAIGAIGIARCLFFSSTHGGYIHQKPAVSGSNTASMHFHEKLFRIPGLMKTKKGREMALKRMPIMHAFVECLEEEW
jgi:uncharacterized protein